MQREKWEREDESDHLDFLSVLGSLHKQESEVVKLV